MGNYSCGAIHDSEHAALLDSVRDAAENTDFRDFVKVGVWKAATCKGIAQLLCDLRRPSRLIGVDPDRRSFRNWMKRCDGYSHGGFREVEYQFVLGSLVSASKIVSVGRCAWIYLDGCCCDLCTSKDLVDSARLLGPGGILVVRGTDPRHAVFGSKTGVRHHGGGARPFGVQVALKRAKLGRRGFEVVSTVPGVEDGSEIRGGLSIYRKKPPEPEIIAPPKEEETKREEE